MNRRPGPPKTSFPSGVIHAAGHSPSGECLTSVPSISTEVLEGFSLLGESTIESGPLSLCLSLFGLSSSTVTSWTNVQQKNTNPERAGVRVLRFRIRCDYPVFSISAKINPLERFFFKYHFLKC